jgi:O-antigen ligase
VVLLSVLFFLIFYLNLPTNPLNSITPVEVVDSGSNDVDRLVKICMIVVSLIVIASRLRTSRQLVAHLNPGLAIMMVLIPLSTFWSISPTDTLLRFVTLGGIFLVCFAIAVVGWNANRVQQVVLPPVMYVLLASLVLGAMYPDRIIETGTDISLNKAWHGITHSKNLFGIMGAMGCILCANLWLTTSRHAFWSIAGATASLACLLLSRSNTSLFAAALAIAFMFAAMRVHFVRQKFTVHLVIAITSILVVSELLIQQVIPGISVLLAPITSLTGKDATFSARTIIWEIIKEHISYSPLLGTGYGAYWTGAFPSSPSYIFMYRMYFYPTEAHNGYLDIINDLGYVGLGCVILFMFFFIRQALQVMHVNRSQAVLALALFYVEMVINMSESEWFSRSSSFAVLLLTSTCMARTLLEHRLQMQSPARVPR